MSDKKITFEEMSFHYEYAMRKALADLFTEGAEHGWTEEEFTKLNYEEALKNALEGSERVLH